MATKGERRRLELFDEMAKDLASAGQGDGSTVLCPICSSRFARDAVSGAQPTLTIEHILPDAIGSSADTLTCTRCNSGATKNVESDLVERVRYEHAFKGRGGSVPALMRTTNGEQLVRVSVKQDGSFDLVGCNGTWNSPAAKALIAEFEQGEVRDFNLVFPRTFDSHRSRVALVKAAYLFLFRAFGYEYILRPVLDVVRRQILTPEERLAPSRFILEFNPGEHRPVFADRATYLVCEKADFLLVLLDIGTEKLVGVPMANRRGGCPYETLEPTRVPGRHLRVSISRETFDMRASNNW